MAKNRARLAPQDSRTLLRPVLNLRVPADKIRPAAGVVPSDGSNFPEIVTQGPSAARCRQRPQVYSPLLPADQLAERGKRGLALDLADAVCFRAGARRYRGPASTD